jgi:hypothetical protein
MYHQDILKSFDDITSEELYDWNEFLPLLERTAYTNLNWKGKPIPTANSIVVKNLKNTRFLQAFARDPAMTPNIRRLLRRIKLKVNHFW